LFRVGTGKADGTLDSGDVGSVSTGGALDAFSAVGDVVVALFTGVTRLAVTGSGVRLMLAISAELAGRQTTGTEFTSSAIEADTGLGLAVPTGIAVDTFRS